MLLLLCPMIAAGCGGVAEQDAVAPVRFLRQVEWATTGVWLKADTHTHSQFSDGMHSVAEIADKAAEYGCDVLAITDHADHDLGAGTHEYIEAIEAARRDHPDMVILSGLEWNIPPYGGDEHIVVLFPQTQTEGQLLAEFKARFDDLGREEHDAALADEGLEWLEALGAAEGLKPVAIYEHPSRKRRFANQIVGDLRRWRAVNEVVVGFAGAPGHQGMEPVGAYKSQLKTISRWDPAAAKPGDAWDRLLGKGIDVWAALASSDFHDARPDGLADYWPGQFSETWLYASEKSPQGVLNALRAGTFYAEHGHIVRNVELLVELSGLPRPAIPGDCIEAPAGTPLSVRLRFQTPATDWSGKPNRIDTVELVTVVEGKVNSDVEGQVLAEGPALKRTLAVPDHGIVFRARGRHGDLMFYTNPIRVVATPASDEI